MVLTRSGITTEGPATMPNFGAPEDIGTLVGSDDSGGKGDQA
jgi:hypothetical protein